MRNVRVLYNKDFKDDKETKTTRGKRWRGKINGGSTCTRLSIQEKRENDSKQIDYFLRCHEPLVITLILLLASIFIFIGHRALIVSLMLATERSVESVRI